MSHKNWKWRNDNQIKGIPLTPDQVIVQAEDHICRSRGFTLTIQHVVTRVDCRVKHGFMALITNNEGETTDKSFCSGTDDRPYDAAVLEGRKLLKSRSELKRKKPRTQGAVHD